MSEQKEQKTYAPVSAKQITFQSGKSILKLGINAEKFKAFLDTHKNAKGYVNLGISERKEVSRYGETHTIWLDTWQPDDSKAAPRQPSSPRREADEVATVQPADQDVPF